jgi:hypothetical protein
MSEHANAEAGAADGGKKKKKKSKKSDAGATAPKAISISIAAHPRAKRAVRRIRARTAIVAFMLVLILSYRSGVPNQEAVVRALIAGLVGNLAGWACAVAVWRHLMMAELRIVADARNDRRRARAEAAATAAAARAERSSSVSA